MIQFLLWYLSQIGREDFAVQKISFNLLQWLIWQIRVHFKTDKVHGFSIPGVVLY